MAWFTLWIARTSVVPWQPTWLQPLAVPEVPIDAVCEVFMLACLPLPRVTWHWSQVWADQKSEVMTITASSGPVGEPPVPVRWQLVQ